MFNFCRPPWLALKFEHKLQISFNFSSYKSSFMAEHLTGWTTPASRSSPWVVSYLGSTTPSIALPSYDSSTSSSCASLDLLPLWFLSVIASLLLPTVLCVLVQKRIPPLFDPNRNSTKVYGKSYHLLQHTITG